MYVVECPGFLQIVRREFESLERAQQWTRQVCKTTEAKIYKAED